MALYGYMHENMTQQGTRHVVQHGSAASGRLMCKYGRVVKPRQGYLAALPFLSFLLSGSSYESRPRCK